MDPKSAVGGSKLQDQALREGAMGPRGPMANKKGWSKQVESEFIPIWQRRLVKPNTPPSMSKKIRRSSIAFELKGESVQ